MKVLIITIPLSPSKVTVAPDSAPTPEPGTLEDTALANARARRRHYESLSEDNHEGKTEEGGQKESGQSSK